MATRGVNRNHHIIEGQFVEFALAGHLANRANLNARRPHIDQQEADACLLGTLARGAHQKEAPLGKLGGAGPYLAAPHPVVPALAITLTLRAGAQAGEIGTGVGLGIALTPDFRVAGQRRQEAGALLIIAVQQQRGA